MVDSTRSASDSLEPAPGAIGGSAQSAASSHDRRRRFERMRAPLRDDLYRFAVWLTRDRALAEDIVQETLVRAWSSLDALQDERAVRPWLLRIVRRETARAYGRNRHPETSIDELIDTNDPALAATVSPDVADLRRAIFALDDEYREPLVLQVLMGFTTAEIAEITRINPATVLTRLFRARHRLRADLGMHLD